MKFKILKTYYGSCLLEIEAETEQDALQIAENTNIDLDENLGNVNCEVQN